MSKETITPESLNAIADLGRDLTKLYVRYARIVESAPAEIAERMELNNLKTIRDRMKQVLDRSLMNEGQFQIWKAEIDAVNEEMAATKTPSKKKGT